MHPDAPGRYFDRLDDYSRWEASRSSQQPSSRRPTVGLLLYRKHVISRLPYVGELIRGLVSVSGFVTHS